LREIAVTKGKTDLTISLMHSFYGPETTFKTVYLPIWSGNLLPYIYCEGSL